MNFKESLHTFFGKPYALKALPVGIIWLQLIYEMCLCDYSTPEPTQLSAA